ncbi:hypothetical protein ThidrDRAFT_0023 [Thiorhodococcus drewsii AZ1]|uniref:CheW-like domain-containing protein n=1 Tax=Thiorhodococcus drewsii AZ1 TaxID=765913 RepID=G2DVW2_9GAMM|nr:chemotaxis protein CheW [Thiorhodococcus drewsii]EGV33868.1 hypothetical protein ThidrDRAFT_0023 [Thiorhodococcus drewsii AZ1]
MSRCSGWLLTFAGDAQAVIGQRELLHLVHRSETHQVPCAPPYCRRVLLWEQGVLPVFDVGVWADPSAQGIADPIVAVVGFQSADGASSHEFGGLLLASAPQRIDVDDAWACELPSALQSWRRISCACFERDERPLPVLDLQRLFN